jgi:putative membrane protein
MNAEILIRYGHFLGILAIASSLVAEHLLIKPSLTRREIGRLATIDGIYGVGALLVLGCGLGMWLGGFKNADYYTQNPVFHTKLTLFVIMGILSIWPTVFFLKQRKGNADEVVAIPKRIVMFLRIELLIVFVMPLLATGVARGVGMG